MFFIYAIRSLGPESTMERPVSDLSCHTLEMCELVIKGVDI